MTLGLEVGSLGDAGDSLRQLTWNRGCVNSPCPSHDATQRRLDHLHVLQDVLSSVLSMTSRQANQTGWVRSGQRVAGLATCPTQGRK